MATPFLGEIRMVGFTFAPKGWAFCNGQLLPIAQNTALFSLLGTTYGGNGQTTFALPDLRGRVPVHVGQGPGLSNYDLGQAAGVEAVTLTASQIPIHTHTLNASGSQLTSNRPAGAVPARGGAYGSASDAPTTMDPSAIGSTGGSQPHTIIQPFLTINFVIALQGIFPSQN